MSVSYAAADAMAHGRTNFTGRYRWKQILSHCEPDVQGDSFFLCWASPANSMAFLRWLAISKSLRARSGRVSGRSLTDLTNANV